MTAHERLLAEAYFENDTFSGFELAGLDLSRKELQGCTFRHVKLPDSRWTGAVLEDCTFELCDLSNMVLKGMAARDVRFSECKLVGVDWSGLAPGARIDFEGCDLRYASFAAMHLRKTRLVRCNLAEATFADVDLTESDFEDSDLSGCSFRDCVLRHADLSRARGVLVDPAHNRARGVRVSVEAAVLLARSAGMVVSGVDEPERRSKRRA